MSKRNHGPLWILAGTLALVGIPVAQAGLNEMSRKQVEKSREAAEQPRAPRERQSAPPRQERAPQAQNPGSGNPQPQASRGNDRGDRGDRGGRGNGGDARGNDRGGERGVIGGALERNFGTRPDRDRDRDGRGEWRGDRGNDHNHGYRDHRRPRYVNTLPRGYRNYSWNGRPYYFYGGSWYRPYGSTYISIGAPYGLFVGTLPGYYSSFWYGNTRYFYADDTYYVYEPVQRGYVVARSPYGDDDEEVYEGVDEDLFIYPARGQSEKQQSDDRYECHRWAADETRYDPIDDEYDADQRADYVRAMTACLTGRGYSVK